MLEYVLGAFLFGEAVIKLFLMIRYTIYERSEFRIFFEIVTYLQSPPVVVVGLGPTLTSCATEFAAPVWVGFVDWIVPLVYGTILCTLALIKGRQYWKEVGCFGTNLVKVLIVDQAVYYIVYVADVSFIAQADSQPDQ